MSLPALAEGGGRVQVAGAADDEGGRQVVDHDVPGLVAQAFAIRLPHGVALAAGVACDALLRGELLELFLAVAARGDAIGHTLIHRPVAKPGAGMLHLQAVIIPF